jgi:hypothetical protein
VLVVFVDFCSYLHTNQLTGTIPSTVAQLSSLAGWYEFAFHIDRLSLRLQRFPLDLLGERPFTVALSILT